MFETREFGGPSNGLRASLVTIANSSGIRARVTNFGATLVSLEVPDRDGCAGDVILGFDRVEDYVANAGFYLGATVGRFANRVARGRFKLDGREYCLPVNDAPGGVACHLHGGAEGFQQRLWKIEDVQSDAVRFSYRSADGEEGYPGTLDANVTYRVGPGRVLTWTAEAVTDRPTVVNLAHHPYWNLSGNPRCSIDRHVLQLFAPAFLPVGTDKIPTGDIFPVEGGAMDFREPRAVGAGGGVDYDHCWVLNGANPEGDVVMAARLEDPDSGRVLELLCNQPGIQFYAGQFLDGSAVGKNGIRYGSRSGLCLEPENFPDSPNHPDFPSCRLAPGETYLSRVVYRFGP